MGCHSFVPISTMGIRNYMLNKDAILDNSFSAFSRGLNGKVLKADLRYEQCLLIEIAPLGSSEGGSHDEVVVLKRFSKVREWIETTTIMVTPTELDLRFMSDSTSMSIWIWVVQHNFFLTHNSILKMLEKADDHLKSCLLIDGTCYLGGWIVSHEEFYI